MLEKRILVFAKIQTVQCKIRFSIVFFKMTPLDKGVFQLKSRKANCYSVYICLLLNEVDNVSCIVLNDAI